MNKLNYGSRAIREDPWTVFESYRIQGPVIRMKMPFMGSGWAVTTYEAVNSVLKDSERFVRDPRNAGRKSFGAIQWILPRVFFSLMHNMLGADGAKHRRLRSVVDQAFARRNIEGMSKRIGHLTSIQLDHVESIAQQDGQVDLIEHLARPLPLAVICELLGLPDSDREKFLQWFQPLATVKNVLGLWAIGRGLKRMSAYLKRQFEEVRACPREGLISELVQIEHEGDQLNEQELLSMVFLLLVAGHETTVHLISNAVLTLLQQPTVREELCGDWTLCGAAVDEVLRHSSPIQMAKPRIAAEDITFHDVEIKRGETLFPLLACANYDPQRFERPREFDLHRERNYHMTFGSGPHVCLGMKLARNETTAALQGLFERFPRLEPGFDLGRVDWGTRPGTRAINSMVVRLK